MTLWLNWVLLCLKPAFASTIKSSSYILLPMVLKIGYLFSVQEKVRFFYSFNLFILGLHIIKRNPKIIANL